MSTPFPLGRHAEQDPRSLNYPAATLPISYVRWARVGRVLDQGQVGSCTGNATAQCQNHRPLFRLGQYRDEARAVGYYSYATRVDPWDGIYPPDDTGSSGLAAAKGPRCYGDIVAYNHAFGAEHAMEALGYGPLSIGTDWYNDMFNPDSRGFVTPTGGIAGGHQYVLDGIDRANGWVRFQNSWSDQWGKMGRFWMTIPDFTTLLGADGDAIALAV